MNMLLLMIGAHYLCDYPLQGDFLAKAKNHRAPIPGVPWYQALFAHAFIQGSAVYLITGAWEFLIAETVCHAIIDYGKNDSTIDYNTDQALHLLCKGVWYFGIAYGFVTLS